jgi:hypothetical protein
MCFEKSKIFILYKSIDQANSYKFYNKNIYIIYNMTNIKHFRNVSIIHAYVLLFISILQIIHIDNTDRFLINLIISIIFLYQVLKLDSKQFKLIQNFIQKYYTLAFLLNLILISSTLLNLYFGVQVLENLLINNKIFFENLTGTNYIMSSFECIINVFINFFSL